MTSWIRFTAFALSLLLTACSAHSQAPFAEEAKAKTDLREAIFRYMFAHYNYGSYVKVFCIRPERPQPESFLTRFAGNGPHVVWDSDCDNSGPMSSVRHKKTGESGMRMSILSINWIPGDEAEAHVEAFSDGIAANWNALSLTYKNGHWKVTGDKSEGVS